MCTCVSRGSQAREITRLWKIEVQIGTKQKRPLSRAIACESAWRSSFDRTAVTLDLIKGASHSAPTSIHDVRVDHGCRDIAMAKQFLDCADVVAALQHVRRERVTQNMRGARLVESGAARSYRHGLWTEST